MLTRGQVAKRLGKSIATVRRLEGVELHPQRDAGGVLRFDPREVQRVASRMRHTQHGRSIGLTARSDRFNASQGADDDLEQDDPEEREHRERLRLREEERRAYDELQRREREERSRREEELIRADAEAARLDGLRSRVIEHANDLVRLLRSSSPRDLRRLRRDPAFLLAMDELFGDT